MSSTLIVIIAAVIVVLVLAVVFGLFLARRRRISLREREQLPEKPESRSGGYTASSGFNLASGAAGTAERTEPPETPQHPVADRTETEGQPTVGDDAAVPRDTQRRGIVDVGLPTEPAETETGTADTAPSTEPAPTEAEPAPEPTEAPSTEAPSTEAPSTEAPSTEAPSTEAGPAEAEPTKGPADVARAPVEPAPEPEAPQPETAQPETGQPETAQAPEPEEIAPSEGRLERLRGRLSRSRSTFGQGLLGLLGAGDLDEDSWTDIEDTLIMADLGSATTMEIVEQLRTAISSRGVRTAAEARTALRDVLVTALDPDADRAVRALPHADGPGVVLIAGVNGTGKTTTTGKLGRVLVAQGRKVLFGAADTFRAAAVDQLRTWGGRVGAETVRGAEGADPAAVAFDAVQRGGESGIDTVLIDTAGRLHTKTGLMDELGKVKRVVEKQAKVDEVLLVLDATTGQNGLAQARVFAEVVDITGIVLTKLDGTAKGGIVFQVQRELGVPVKLVGLGEGADDLAPFEPAAFVDALLAE